MYGYDNDSYSRIIADESEQRAFITKTYGWMSLGLLITAVMSFITINTPRLLYDIANKFWIPMIIGEIILVFAISGLVNRLSAYWATFLFVVYAVLNGMTLSVILALYLDAYILGAFVTTAGMFGIMTVYGIATKKDLTSWRNVLLMGLIGIIIASIVNIFISSYLVDSIVSYIGVIIFTGLTAYDAQRIKNMAVDVGGDSELGRKASIIGALALYLDFINLFLYILRIFGRRK